VGLGEVLCAVLWAWLLVGEAITPVQAVGGAVVLGGLALAGRSSDHRATESMWPEIARVDDVVPPADGADGKESEPVNG
jgi:hypothetical protein